MWKIRVVDPPEGWLYGFPKPMPSIALYKDRVKWFLAQGYPQELIDQGMLQYCRYWDEEIEDVKDI